MTWFRLKNKPSEAWFEGLVHGHIDELTAFAWRLCGDREQAEDLVQETFAEAWKGIGRLRKLDSARAWLFRVLRRRYARLVRSQIARPELMQMDEETGFWDGIASQAPSPHAHAASRDYLEKVLATLDDRFRLPLLMAVMEGLTTAEIGEELGLPVGTVLSRIHRARQHLQAAATELDNPRSGPAPEESTNIIELDAMAHERRHHGS